MECGTKPASDGLNWYSEAIRCPSPNFNVRPDPNDISLLVIHNISLPPKEFGGRFIEQFFCNKLDWDAHPYFSSIRGLEVSAHVLIRRTGEVIQFVPFCERAWHAGRSCFDGREECNDFSIGIELEGADDLPFDDAQYTSLIRLTKTLMIRYPKIVRDRIVGHSDIAPGRKTDPGSCFDWNRYLSALQKLRC